MPRIRDAVSAADIEHVRDLFREYQAAIGVDLSFQGFAEELATLPGTYSRPAGRLLLAVDDTLIKGCIAVRPLRGLDAELERLYVPARWRGAGIGRLLATCAIAEARIAGYARVLLDTLPSMSEARALYRALGFTEVPPYCHNPMPGALYFGLELQDARGANR
jgi:GNAT superfamily N-acetyltransferase